MKNFFQNIHGRDVTIFFLGFAFVWLVLRFIGLVDFPIFFLDDEYYAAVVTQCLWRDGIGLDLTSYPLFGVMPFARYAKPSPFPPTYMYPLYLWYFLFDFTKENFRLLSAIFGLISIFFISLTGKNIFNKKFAIYCFLFAAISPWSFHQSRLGWELSCALFYLSLALYLVTLEKSKFFWLSPLIFAAAVYTYPPFKVGVPITVTLLLFWRHLYRDKLNLKKLGLYGILFVIPLIPLIHFTITSDYSDLNLRFKGNSAWVDSGVSPIQLVFENFLKWFKIDFLFVNGTENAFLNRGTPFLEIYTSFFAVLTLMYLVYKMIRKKVTLNFFVVTNLLFLMLFLGGVGADLLTKTFITPTLTRSYGAFPFYIFMIASLTIFWTEKYRVLHYLLILLITIHSYTFLNHYFTRFTKYTPFSFDKSISQFANNMKDQKAVNEFFAHPQIPKQTKAFYWLLYDKKVSCNTVIGALQLNIVNDQQPK